MYSHAHTLFFILMLFIHCLAPECDSCWHPHPTDLTFLKPFLKPCLGIVLGDKEGTNISHTNHMQNPLIIRKTP